MRNKIITNAIKMKIDTPQYFVKNTHFTSKMAYLFNKIP